jgi:enediyne biosynthesis protein E4
MRLLALLTALLLSHGALYGQAKGGKAPTSAPITFVDATTKAGLQFHLTCGTKQKLYIMDAMCGGIAFFDYDNDGWADIFLLNGSTLEQLKAGASPPSKLYRNQQNGTFKDVTAALGITHRGWGMGVAAGDYDGDGFTDLYLTYLDHAVLYRNERGKRFVDATKQAGVDNGGRWGTSAAWGDYDQDGHLDLYVANYVTIDLNNLPPFGTTPFCQYRGIKVSCGPRGLPGSRDRLYRNRGNGTFEDVAEKLNIDPDAHYGLGVMFLDYNNDGCQDIYVSDDSSPSLLYKGDCRGGMEEVGVAAGVAYSADGLEQAGMGIDAGDYDGDGDFDIAKINFSDDMNNLYRNDGTGEFTDVTGPSRFGPISTPFLGFGVRFADFDNDGWLDVFVANGHVNPQVDGQKFGVSYAERNLLFHNRGDGTFDEIGEKAGPAIRLKRVGRGLATADFDHDGRLDVLVSNLDGAPLLLRNTSRAGNWIGVRIPHGTGARVEVHTEARVQTAAVRANQSYLSSSDPTVHFGLRDADAVKKVEVRFANGVDKVVNNPSINSILEVQP